VENNLSSQTTKKSTLREYTEAFVIAILLALFIRTFVIQAFKIPSGSMLPTLQIGDHLLVGKFIYGVKIPFSGQTLVPFKDPRRGDIIVFKYPKDRSIDYIKRVIGEPGDTLEIKNKQIFINNTPIEDPHAHFTSRSIMNGNPRDNLSPITVPLGKVFVMGDNRDNSHDSRFWGFVDQKDILGKAFIIYWSWDITTPLLSFDRLTSVRWGRIGDIIH
jgi:signal peptidase I